MMFGIILVLAIIGHISNGDWVGPLPLYAILETTVSYDRSLFKYFSSSHELVSGFLDEVLYMTSRKLKNLRPRIGLSPFYKKYYFRGNILPSKLWLQKLHDERAPGSLLSFFCLNRSGENGTPIYGGFKGFLETNRSVIINAACNHPDCYGHTNVEQMATVFAHQLGRVMGMRYDFTAFTYVKIHLTM